MNSINGWQTGRQHKPVNKNTIMYESFPTTSQCLCGSYNALSLLDEPNLLLFLNLTSYDEPNLLHYHSFSN